MSADRSVAKLLSLPSRQTSGFRTLFFTFEDGTDRSSRNDCMRNIAEERRSFPPTLLSSAATSGQHCGSAGGEVSIYIESTFILFQLKCLNLGGNASLNFQPQHIVVRRERNYITDEIR